VIDLSTVSAHVVVLCLSAAVAAGLATYAWRRRSEPGALPFAALMGAIFVWASTYAVGLATTDPFWHLQSVRVRWLGIATVPLWLFLFALEYTGHDEFVTVRTAAPLVVVPTATIIGVWTNGWHGLLWTDFTVTVERGLALPAIAWGPLFWFHVVFMYVLVVVAVVLVVRLVFVSDHLYTDQSVLLLVGIAAPLLANAVDVLVPAQRVVVDYTPHAFTVSGLAFGYALFRHRLLDLVPATRQLGRNAAIAQLDTGVVIVGTDRRIVYCNAAAGEMLRCDPTIALDRTVRELLPDDAVDFETADALASFERDDRVYEVERSPITDRRDRRIGHTLVIHDVTAREERERRLVEQRDELATLDDLNRIVRSVNRALVSASSPTAVERALCDRVLEGDTYRRACVADIATWTGDADRWRVATDDDSNPSSPDSDAVSLGDGQFESSPPDTLPTVGTDAEGTWVVVPLVHGRTVYGALGLYTDRTDIAERERAVLRELGETAGYALNAVETERHLSADTVVELELESEDEADPLVAVSARVSCRLEVIGIVPRTNGDHVAYLRAEADHTEAVRDRLDDEVASPVRTVREGATSALVEWHTTGDSILRRLVTSGVNVRHVSAEDSRASYEVEVAADETARHLVDRLCEAFPETRVVAKRERAGPVVRHDLSPGREDFTDRQRDVREAAYRAGYFNWPRDSTAEEEASSLDISSPTLHEQLRKAEETLLLDLFESDQN